MNGTDLYDVFVCTLVGSLFVARNEMQDSLSAVVSQAEEWILIPTDAGSPVV